MSKTNSQVKDVRGGLRKPYFLDGALIAIFAALMAVCAWISIPLPGGVSITLQTFAVFLAVGVLGWKRGTLSVLVYILVGAVGAPVFSGFKGGIATIIGMTGGYIFGFLGSAIVAGLVYQAAKGKLWLQALGMVAGLLVCYAVGTAWFYFTYARENAMSLVAVLGACVIPFIIPDLVKIALATVLSNRLGKYVRL